MRRDRDRESGRADRPAMSVAENTAKYRFSFRATDRESLQLRVDRRRADVLPNYKRTKSDSLPRAWFDDPGFSRGYCSEITRDPSLSPTFSVSRSILLRVVIDGASEPAKANQRETEDNIVSILYSLLIFSDVRAREASWERRRRRRRKRG